MKKITLFASLLLTLQLHAVTPQAAFDAAIVPGADYFGFQSGKAATAPITKQLEPITKKFTDELAAMPGEPTSGFYKNSTAWQELLKSSGISEDNIDNTALSVNFSRLFASCEKLLDTKPGDDFKMPVLTDFNLLLAYSVKKPLADDFVQQLVPASINLFTDGKGSPNVKTQDFNHGGVKGITINITLPSDFSPPLPFTPESVKLRPFAVVLLGDNKVFYAGFEDDVKSAIDRANAGEKTELTPVAKQLFESNLNGKPMSKHDTSFIWVMPPVLKKGAAMLEEMGTASGQLPPGMTPAIDSVKNLKGLRLVADYSDKIEGVANLVLDTPERAKTFRDVIDINVLTMFKMAAYQTTGARSAFADSLKATADANSVSIPFTITAADYAAFFDYVKKIRQQQSVLIPENIEIIDLDE